MSQTTTQATEWVVLGTWTEDGEVRCEVFADGFATEQEADDAGADIALALGSFFEQDEAGCIEVCTREQADECVSQD